MDLTSSISGTRSEDEPGVSEPCDVRYGTSSATVATVEEMYNPVLLNYLKSFFQRRIHDFSTYLKYN